MCVVVGCLDVDDGKLVIWYTIKDQRFGARWGNERVAAMGKRKKECNN